MKLPQNTYANANGSPVVVELLKSLHGLKQAPELWDKFLVSAIKSQGFHQLMHDQCVFIKRTSNNEIIILIKYVDDIIITGNSQRLIQSTLKHFEHSFTKITHEDNIQRYVGIDLDYNKTTQTIKLSKKNPTIRSYSQSLTFLTLQHLTKHYDVLILRYNTITYIIDAHKAKLTNLTLI